MSLPDNSNPAVSGGSIKVCELPNGSRIVSDKEIHFNAKTVTIGKNVTICSDSIAVGIDTVIEDNVHIIAPGKFALGAHSVLRSGFNATCYSLEMGDYFWGGKDTVVGKGGCYGERAILRIGNGCFVGDSCIFNTSEPIEIGDNVGIGEQTNIWTRGAFPSILDGKPSKFAGVTIKNSVWLQGRSIVLPGVTIGRHAIVGMGCVVSKNVDANMFVVGNPMRIIGEADRRDAKAIECECGVIADDYNRLMTFKGLPTHVDFNAVDKFFCLHRTPDSTSQTFFYWKDMNIIGEQDAASEDFRDFLRRRGLRFFNGNRFGSVLPACFDKYKEWR